MGSVGRRVGVLFVCTGNICRSPAAEGIFLRELERRGSGDRFRVDSAGTGGWHAGERADHRTLDEAARRGIPVLSIARVIRRSDHEDFDWIVCMDASHRSALLAAGAPAERLVLVLHHHDQPRDDLEDPYYGGREGFTRMFDDLEVAVRRLADRLGA